MSAASQGSRGSEIRMRSELRAALEAGDQTAATEIARQDLALVRAFADELLKEIKPQLSLAARRAAIAAAPDDPVVHRELMRALILARKADEAAAHAGTTNFGEAARRQLFLQLAEDFFAERRPKQAMATFEAMLRVWPMDEEARHALQRAQILTGRPDEALQRLDTFDLTPQERAVMLQYIAGRLDAQGDKLGALNCHQAAAAAVPQNLDVVRYYLKFLKSVDSDPERLVSAIEDERLQGADKGTLLRELASEESPAKESRIALRRAAAELAPQDVTAVLEYVRAVLDDRGFDAALETLDARAFDRADRVQVLRDMGGFFARIRKHDLAMRCKAEAYARDPERIGVLNELLEPMIQKDGPAATRAYFAAKGIRTDTLLATLKHFIALLLQGERIDLAVPAHRIAAHLAPDSRELVVELAIAAQRWRGFAQALSEIDSSELSDADRIEVLKTLGARNDVDAEFAAACQAEVSRRSPTAGEA